MRDGDDQNLENPLRDELAELARAEAFAARMVNGACC